MRIIPARSSAFPSSPSTPVLWRSSPGAATAARHDPLAAGWLVGAAAFLLGILLSAPFWLPSIAELRYVNITAIESGMFNARLNLLPLTELLSPARILDDAALNPPQPNSLGIAQVIMALAGLAVALKWALAPKRRPGRCRRTRALDATTGRADIAGRRDHARACSGHDAATGCPGLGASAIGALHRLPVAAARPGAAVGGAAGRRGALRHPGTAAHGRAAGAARS